MEAIHGKAALACINHNLRRSTIQQLIMSSRFLWADSVSPRMNTIASRGQFNPIKIGEDLVVNYHRRIEISSS